MTKEAARRQNAKVKWLRKRPAAQHVEVLIDGLVDELSQHLACAQFERASFGCDLAWDWRSSPSAGVVKRRETDGADGCGSLPEETPLL
jgi:hypothetical protein